MLGILFCIQLERRLGEEGFPDECSNHMNRTFKDDTMYRIGREVASSQRVGCVHIASIDQRVVLKSSNHCASLS